MHRFARALAVAAAVSSLAGVALAHPALLGGQPGPNAIVDVHVQELRLSFSEPLFANFSGVVISDVRGRKVSLGRAVLAAGNSRVLIIPLKKPLSAGVYTVDWHAVSADTHRITGSYHFTVR